MNPLEPKIPKVTVLMAVYNGERFLSEAIESILSQTYSDFEFLIINDGSTDNTREILLSYDDPRIRIVDNEQNIGLTKSLNRGLALARGEYIARQDADDISLQKRLDQQMSFMIRHPETAVLGAQVAFMDQQGRPIKPHGVGKPITPLAAKYCLMFGAPVNHPTVVYSRKTVWNEFGGYNSGYMVGQDTELWCRVGLNYCIRNLPQELVKMRIHPSSVSGDLHHPRRADHLELWKTRRPLVMKEVLGGHDIPDEWGLWWELIHAPGPFIGVKPAMNLLAGLDQIHQLFVCKNPQADHNDEILSITSDAKARLAVYMVRHCRFASLIAFYDAFLTSKLTALKYFSKYLALLFFGDLAKKIYTSIENAKSIIGNGLARKS